MKKKCILIIVVLFIDLLLISCIENLSKKEYKNLEEDITAMGKINLHEIDKVSNKKNIDIFLEKIPDYPYDCKMFNFNLKENYDDFELEKTNNYRYDEYEKINAYFRKKEEETDLADVKLLFYKSKLECHEGMRSLLNSFTVMQIYQSDLAIGDFAIGDIYDVFFIRGNVQITIRGYNRVIIEDLAREIDNQILDILTKQASNKTNR